MATSKEYIEFVCESIRGDYEITYKKMFGDYIVYANGKPILLVCDDTVYVKKLSALAELMAGAPCGTPYDGAKEHYVLDVENADLTDKVVAALEKLTSLPKKRPRG